jgi:hypothetical protein
MILKTIQSLLSTPAGKKVFAALLFTGLAACHLVFPQKMERLNIRYPMPMFIGTPKDMQVDNLEKTWELARPPFLVPEGTKNIALGKFVECSGENPLTGDPELVTNGDKEATDGSIIELHEGPQYITIDLEESAVIYAVALWHYHNKARVYYDLVVQVADEPDFIIGVTTLFNNDHDNSLGFGVGEDLHYIETYEGRLIDGRGTVGRYVRLYSNGNTDNDLNHYIEVEVYGKPLP